MTAFRFSTIFVGAAGSKKSCESRCEQISSAMKTADDELRGILNRRLRRLNSGIGILRVGGSTETEIGERKDRVEDALYATRAAMQEGIVAGGGSLLAKLAKSKLGAGEDLSPGEAVVYRAACEPLQQIARNCGSVPEVVLEKISEKPDNFGYNGIDGAVCNLLEAGIVDPVKVTRSGVQHATSAAAILLTTEAAVADAPEPEKEAPAMPDPGMGGMGMGGMPGGMGF